MDNIQIANEIIDYIGENPVPFKSIDDICKDIIEKLQLQVDYDTLYQALEGIYNQATPGGGYTLQQFINNEGRLGYANIGRWNKTEIESLDFSNAVTLSYMFYHTDFDSLSWKFTANNTINQVYSNMFNGATNLTGLDFSEFYGQPTQMVNFLNSSVSASGYYDLTGLDTSNCTSFQNCFNNCPRIDKIDITGWSAERATTTAQMFRIDTNLTSVIGNHTLEEVTRETNPIATLIGLNINMTINTGVDNLERASLRAIINGLADRTGQAQRTLTLSTDLRNKLEEEDIQVVMNKNWILQ